MFVYRQPSGPKTSGGDSPRRRRTVHFLKHKLIWLIAEVEAGKPLYTAGRISPAAGPVPFQPLFGERNLPATRSSGPARLGLSPPDTLGNWCALSLFLTLMLTTQARELTHSPCPGISFLNVGFVSDYHQLTNEEPTPVKRSRLLRTCNEQFAWRNHCCAY